MTPTVPQTFEQWRYCIERECGIRLTPEFVLQRLVVMRHPAADETRRFIRLYGERHWQRVLGWFEAASEAAGQTNTADAEPTAKTIPS